jgi:hypothetical protein
VEGVKHDFFFMHVMEGPLAILLGAANSLNVFDVLGFEFIDKFLNHLSVNRIWGNMYKERKKWIKFSHGCIGIFISLD